MPRLRRSAVIAAVIASVLVAVGIWMVVAGWPMETAAQNALIDLAQLPMSAAVLVAIAEMTYERRLWLRKPVGRFAAVFGPGAALFLIGVVMLVVAFALPARHLVGTAQALIWTGLGVAFLYLAIDSVRREFSANPLDLAAADPDDELDGLWLDDEDESDDDENNPQDVDPGSEGDEVHMGDYGSYQAPRLLSQSPQPETRPTQRPSETPPARLE